MPSLQLGLRHHNPVRQPDNPVSVCGVFLGVGDLKDRDSFFLVDALEKFHNRGACLTVEVSDRLVGQEDAGVRDDCACDGDALLLAAGELAGEVFSPVAETDDFENFIKFLLVLSSFPAAHDDWQEDVVLDGQVLYEVIELEDESDVGAADAALFFVLHLVNIFFR